MGYEFDLDAFDGDLKDTLAKGREAFEGKYASEIKALSGLSRSEIDAITPDGTDLEAYDALIAVVKDASARNLSQAQLKTHITQLGDLAVRIAKRVPSLATLV